jgi:putative flippase GtrA
LVGERKVAMFVQPLRAAGRYSLGRQHPALRGYVISESDGQVSSRLLAQPNQVKNLASSQFSKFLLSGGLAACANLLSRFLFSQFMPYLPAIVLAFIVGLATGFLLMRAFVFSTGVAPPGQQASYFVLVNLVGLVITVVVSIAVSKLAALVLADAQVSEAIGHFAGVTAPVLLSFYAHKNLTFR